MWGKTWMSRLVRPAAVGGCLLLAAGIAACGTSEEEPLPTVPPSPVATLQPLPTLSPDIPLVEYRSPDGSYSIGYPEGWEVQLAGDSPIAAFSWAVDGRPLAQLTILCITGENQTVDGLMADDARIISQAGGRPPTESTPIELAGVEGKQVTYVVPAGGLSAAQVAAYAIKGDCGWRIGLATYGAEPITAYLPLFQRILASFSAD